MTRRRVRPEELELWKQVVRSAEPLSRQHPRPEKKPETMSPKKVLERKAEPPAALPPFRMGQGALPPTETHVFPGTTSDRLRAEQVNMDKRAFTRLKRGKLVPEARIDLHGMTLDQAHPALTRFVITSHSRGLRLVLVITGKGSREDPYDPMPRRRGVLKSQVPQWLRMPPLSRAVLQISEAHQKHGGSGAYYVYLRRSKPG